MNLSSVLKVVQGWVKIKGHTDGTLIGNVGDRLKVDTALSHLPSDSVIYESKKAENGGSTAMDVNGSVTPVIFVIGPPAGQTWYIYEYGIAIEDSGNNNVDSFGAIANGLTNGLLIEQRVSSTDYTFKNLKNNLDLVETFSDHGLRGVANSFLNSTNFYAGKVELREAVTLVGNNSDQIRVTVRDNLTGLDQLKFNIEFFRVV